MPQHALYKRNRKHYCNNVHKNHHCENKFYGKTINESENFVRAVIKKLRLMY